MNVYCLMNPRCRFASSQTPILCGREETEGLKAPGYSKPRLPDVLVHRSQLTTHCSQLIAHRSKCLTSNPFGAICVSKNLGRCTQTSLPLITHCSPLLQKANAVSGSSHRIASAHAPLCLCQRTALRFFAHFTRMAHKPI